MRQGEQQTGTTLEGIKRDHLERYRVAAQFVHRDHSACLDIACGVGYGSFMIAQQSRPRAITAVDCSAEAIEHGKTYFNHPRITYQVADVYRTDSLFPAASFDSICSLETLEHLQEGERFLGVLHRLLKPEGVLIISTPNQDVMPFDKTQFPFHTRHYTTEEFIGTLEKNGFTVLAGSTQVDYHVLNGFGGWINIAVCKKKEQATVNNSPFTPHLLKQSYLSLLKEVRKDALFFQQFGGEETHRLLQLGKHEEAHYLIEKWKAFKAPGAFYLSGYYYREKKNISAALQQYRELVKLPFREDEKKYVVSAYFHLAALTDDTQKKKEYLEKCLELEPGHREALERIRELEK